jgi:2-(1,2-epoxy-1,2-dihydrophenyl)acetyl-CoA isomerase
MLFTGEIVNAQEALRIGLVSRLVPAHEMLNEVMITARRIADQPPFALRLTKSLLRQARTISYDTALELAAANQAIAHLTTDHRERLAALIAQRRSAVTGS